MPKTKLLKILKTFSGLNIKGYSSACQTKVSKFVEASYKTSIGVAAQDAVRIANASA